MANNIIERIWNQNAVGTIEDLSGSAFQAEAGAHTFVISGVDNAGAAVALSGTVAGVFMKPDNTDVALTGSISNGKASVTLTAECYTVPGRFGLTIFVTSGSVKTAVYAAVGTVSRTNTGNVSASAEADVVDLINRINAAVATVPASWSGLMADIAPTYSASAVYPVGAYVYYNGDLYRCTTAITTAESWTPAHWTAAVLGDDVSSLKSALSHIDGNLNLTWEQGGLNFSNSVENGNTNYIRTSYTDVENGAVLYVLNPTQLPIAVHEFDSNKNRIKTSPNKIVSKNFVYSCSSSAAYIRLSCEGTSLQVSQGDDIAIASNGLRAEDIKKLEDANGGKFLDFEYGYINNSGTTTDVSTIAVASLTYMYVLDACSAGDVYYVKGEGAVGARLWAFVDATGNTLSNADINYSTSGEYITLVAPTNAAYFVCNVKSANAHAVFKPLPKIDNIIHLTFDESDFEYGRYLPADQAWHNTTTAIVTKDCIPSYVHTIAVKNANIKACIVIFNKDGSWYNYVAWLRNGDYFRFNHNLYNYKMYILTENEDYIFNFSAMISDIDIYADKFMYANALNKHKAQNAKLNNYVNSLESSVKRIMQSNYDISFANASKPIDLQSYVGDNQIVHPKVLYFSNTFGGHYYWMAYTPYPLALDGYENPCIAYSDDGYEWHNIGGNPLDNPNTSGVYDSDTHLVYRSDLNQIECWYRRVDTTASPSEEIICRRISADGFTWGNEEVLYTNDSGNYDKLLSPAVIWNGTNYEVWVVYRGASIYYYTVDGSDATDWTYIRRIAPTWNYDNTEYIPWHLDVIKDGATYIMVMMCKDNGNHTTSWITFLTTSTDNINYNTPEAILLGSDGWDKFQYRPSITKVGNTYRIYYSAGSAAYGRSSFWGIGITESETLNNFIGKATI